LVLLEHDLRVRLRERRDRLYRAGAPEFEYELERLLGWLEGRPYIAAILREIEAADADYDSWLHTIKGRRLTFPASEVDRTKLCLEICRRGDPDNLTRALTSSHFEDLDRVFVEAFVDPVVNFVEDRLEEGGSILALLLRYKRRVEWFDRVRLFGAAGDEPARAERLLDSDLRRFLLESGVDYPFSRRAELPDAESRIADDQPLALEIRVYAPEPAHDIDHLREGFAQAIAFAVEHARPAGYLTVFNLAPERLVFRTSAPRGQVPSVRTNGKRIFVVSIHANPDVALDPETGRAARIEIEESFLAGEPVAR
jgi:hypothetical protein